MKKWLICLMALITVLLSLCAYAEEKSAELSAIVYFQDGSYVLLPDSIAMDNDALAAYCNTYFPGRAYTLDPNAAAFNYDAVIDEAYASQLYGEGNRAMSVRLMELGIYESAVYTTLADELTVPSKHLIIRGFDDAQHHIASVYAPRTGEATLRDDPSGKGKTISKAKTGKVAAVLEYSGGTYTKILYDGEEGYIRTDCLIFHPGESILGKGVLHIKGAADGGKTVTLRAAESSSAVKVTALPTGTEVTVHSGNGEWYAVEARGWYGYVHEQYLEMKAE